jgi:DNA polymerase V
MLTIPIAAGEAHQLEQIVEWINIDEYVKSGMHSTYYLRVYGDSMEEKGIFDGDLLVVERRESAETGNVVIAEINGEFTVKRFNREKKRLFLVPANGKYLKREIKIKDDFAIWGVVTHIIHKV